MINTKSIASCTVNLSEEKIRALTPERAKEEGYRAITVAYVRGEDRMLEKELLQQKRSGRHCVLVLTKDKRGTPGYEIWLTASEAR